jgi:heat shock protein HspQ
MDTRIAKFRLGQVVRHRVFPFRGVIYDVDPQFSSTDAWWRAIPEDTRPSKDQPFYHLYADNGQTCYEAYVSEQNLLLDDSGEPVEHPAAQAMFDSFEEGAYRLSPRIRH